MNLSRIFDGAYLRADLVRRGSDRLMVTFDYRRLDRTGFAEVAPSRQFADAGFDQLIIATRDNDWFINAETTSLEAACLRLRGDYRIARALGFSMGGFGAFRFARALGLGNVVAVSPQVSIAPGVVPFETRYRREARAFDPGLGDMTALHDPALEGDILIDPFNLNDLTHARMLQLVFPRVRLIRLPGGGHPCTRVLRAVRRAGLVQALAIGPATGATHLRQAHRAGRGGTVAYWHALSHAAGRLHPRLAAQAAQNAAKLTTGTDDGVDDDRDSA
ncbi:alpha/beta hydrolase [Loktanella sp. DJP18]|uniref:alpha/beta hydrolase n=1 Tax=Loktanella sp. DJP18 TaxID=3409788 RepID=UPI003BB4A157